MSVKKSLVKLEKIINNQFHEKYLIKPNNYNIMIIEHILYNDKNRLVSIFKDNMISDDIFEFLSNFYNISESPTLLSKCLSYYDKNCVIYPNYISLPESKYLFKNINDKRRILDEYEIQKKRNIINIIDKDEEEKKIFDNSVYDSIMKESNYSNFDFKKEHEKMDSITGINNLVSEMETYNDKIKYDFNLQNENKDRIKITENEKKENNTKIEKLKIINKSNFCYNKFENKYRKNILLYNKIKKKTKNIQSEKNLSSIYIKSNIKQKILNNKINNSKKAGDYFPFLKNMNDSLFNYLNMTKYNTEENKNNSVSKRINVYKKYSPINQHNKFSFSIKKKEMNHTKESVKLIKTKNDIKKISGQKCDLNIEVYSYVNKPNNIVNYTVKNQYYNNNLAENKTPIHKGNKVSFVNRQIKTEYNDDDYKKNILEIIPGENTIYIFNNNCINKGNYNIKYKEEESRAKTQHLELNRIRPTLSKGNQHNSIKIQKKMKSYNNIVNSITNKLKKENKNNISQRILLLMKNKKEFSKIHRTGTQNELNKNITSLKKFILFNNKKKERRINLRYKLMKSLDESNTKYMNTTSISNSSHKNFKQLKNSLNRLKMKEVKKLNLNENKKNHPKLSSVTSPFKNKNKFFFNPTSIHNILSEKRDMNKNYILFENNFVSESLQNLKNVNDKQLSTKNKKKILKEKFNNRAKKKNKLILIDNKIIRNNNAIINKNISLLTNKDKIFKKAK